MELYCTRSGCPRPQNKFSDLDDSATLKTVSQKYCTACGMPLILAGRYLPLQLLGKGGFGTAFRARDRYTPGMRCCVVKQFKPAGDLTPAQLQIAQQLFEREAEVLEELGTQHAQIPDLYAFFELTVVSLQSGGQDKFFYLVQEFIDGKTLEEELARKGQFSPTEVLAVLQAILPVLQFVHEHGSIHRDIKPSNIMRDRNGRFYLLDFGAVKQVTKAVGTAQGSTGIYSQGYAPAEQMAGSNVYPSTDLYALAVTAVVLLTGKQPIELFDAYSNRWHWRSQVGLSPVIADVLERMLLFAPNQRYQSAQEALSALDAAISTASTLPPPIQPPTPPMVPQPHPGVVLPAFSTWEMLCGAGLSGIAGGLIAIALFTLFGSLPITLGITAVILGVLIFAQTRRWLALKDLLIIIGITFVVVLVVPMRNQSTTLVEIIVLSLLAGAAAIAFIAMFRLIYKLLSSILK